MTTQTKPQHSGFGPFITLDFVIVGLGMVVTSGALMAREISWLLLSV